MEEQKLKPYIEEIKKALEDKVDENTIESELNKYIYEYHINIDSAKKGIIRKYGGIDSISLMTSNSTIKKISELTGSERNIDVIAKVLYIENKCVLVNGLKKVIISGIIGDDTSTASLTVWEPKDIVLESGLVYTFKNCYCKTWNNNIQINLGNRGYIELEPNTNINITSTPIYSHEYKIGEIKDGIGNVTVTGRILTMQHKDITTKNGDKTIYFGIIADDTGKIQYSAWKDFSIKENDAVCIKNAYIRSWKGIPQLNMGDRCEVNYVNSLDFDIIDTHIVKKTIADISKIGGGLDITIEGVVVDIKPGSGLINRCPICKRVISGNNCIDHGLVSGFADTRMKIVLDDGTGSITAIINSDNTTKLTGIGIKEAKGLYTLNGEDSVDRELASKVLMHRLSITGNVMSDDYGLSMIVKK